MKERWQVRGWRTVVFVLNSPVYIAFGQIESGFFLSLDLSTFVSSMMHIRLRWLNGQSRDANGEIYAWKNMWCCVLTRAAECPRNQCDARNVLLGSNMTADCTLERGWWQEACWCLHKDRSAWDKSWTGKETPWRVGAETRQQEKIY